MPLTLKSSFTKSYQVDRFWVKLSYQREEELLLIFWSLEAFFNQALSISFQHLSLTQSLFIIQVEVLSQGAAWTQGDSPKERHPSNTGCPFLFFVFFHNSFSPFTLFHLLFCVSFSLFPSFLIFRAILTSLFLI